jgi:two-component system, NtrC family, sensor kinase
MKALMLIIYFYLFSFLCVAQRAEIFRIDSFPEQGVLLNKNWKWIAGDNPDFAKRNFDDSVWESIDPTKEVVSLPEFSKEGQIYWIRLSLSVDKSIEQPLMMSVSQIGASEIYLNGKLIHTFGIIQNDPQQVKAFDPHDRPLSFPVSQDSIQLLAIRYSLQPNVTYATHFGRSTSALSITLNTTQQAVSNYTTLLMVDFTGSYFKGGVHGILFILFLSLYIFFPSLKANLYFAIFNFLLAISWTIILPIERGPIWVEDIFWVLNSVLVIQTIGYSFKLTSVYSILEQKRSWVFYGIVTLGIVSMMTGTFVYGWGWHLYGFVLSNILYLDVIRVSFIAIRNQKKGAWIIIAGGLIYLISWSLFCLQFYFNATFEFLGFIQVYLFDIALLSIPVAFAIFLGYNFGVTSSVLQQKLVENVALAEEKQNILASQNITLETQVRERTLELQHSLDNLKSTQSQLIQSEKMASLGELTAGIAHEIQNPLNFVNNFSEVSNELIKEIQDIRHKTQDQSIKTEEDEILNDIASNLEKINHHGKRAADIVKGMLQHSRSSGGVKEPTDINALADEYLRLAYHGLRAKDKSFNATMKTDFDESIGNINIIPQDIGRVILNLITNAFYAVNERQKLLATSHELLAKYEPTVSVRTRKEGNKVLISVKDNGNGIPDSIKEKIFQPFFTTKPTGQGTGLGLSLSYDIVKAHGGNILVSTQAGVGTEFVVDLPVQL